MGLGPKLLSYRAGSGKGGFFKGTLSGPFSSSDAGDGEGDGSAAKAKAEKRRTAEQEEAKRTARASIWSSWGKRWEKQAAVEEVKAIKDPEGVEVSRVCWPRCAPQAHTPTMQVTLTVMIWPCRGRSRGRLLWTDLPPFFCLSVLLSLGRGASVLSRVMVRASTCDRSRVW